MKKEAPPSWVIRDLPAIGLGHLVGREWLRLDNDIDGDTLVAPCNHGLRERILEDGRLLTGPILSNDAFLMVYLRRHVWMGPPPERRITPFWIGECRECGRAYWASPANLFEAVELVNRFREDRTAGGTRFFTRTFRVTSDMEPTSSTVAEILPRARVDGYIVREMARSVWEIEILYTILPATVEVAQHPPEPVELDALKELVKDSGGDGGIMFTAEGGFRYNPSEN